MRTHKWVVASVLVICLVLYWVPVFGTLFMYGMGEPGRIRGFGGVLMLWSFGEWFRTIWVFTRSRKHGEPLAGDRWFVAAIVIIGSTIGGVMALFIAPSLSSSSDRATSAAALIVIASHWWGRWYLRRVGGATT